MAFSYSDENFTVVGNLCFVHIILDGTESVIDIPHAIGDRMLVNNIVYPYLSHVGNVDIGLPDNYDMGLAVISNNKISLHGIYNKGYIMCYFPIDSNK